MISAPVNKILPYSVVDGPGNRVSIFFQKCNIHCAYCHNPETQRLCVNCGACVKQCPAGALTVIDKKVCWDSEKCCQCDTCIAVCPNHASPKVTEMTPEQVFAKVQESIPFIRGITVSGGECALYPEFLVPLFKLAHGAGLTCLMDSNGTIDLSRYPELMEICDGVMLDVKSWDGGVFHALTGGENDTVKQNLRYLYDTGKLEEVRIVCLPGYVDAETTVDGIADTLGDVSKVFLKLIRFRPFGVRGDLEGHPAPSMAFMNRLKARAESRGFRRVLIL